jgi:hypothetical protein
MSEKAVIDRFEKNVAVLLVREGPAERQVNVDRALLPEGVRAGQWLQVEFEGTAMRSALVDPEQTAHMKAEIAAKLERLRSGNPPTQPNT